jgi:hypothetical protein
MITLTDFSEDNYFLPEDGMAARQAFLDILSVPGPCYVHAFGFNMPEAFAILADLEARGYPQHLLLDYTQSRGTSAVGLVTKYASVVSQGSLTLTTAGAGSRLTSQIWHSKAVTKIPEDGSEPICWEGSVNMSASGWYQGNTARVFRSKAWSDAMIAQYTVHRAWAREHMAHKQVSALSVQDEVALYFRDLETGSSESFGIEALGWPGASTEWMMTETEGGEPLLELSFMAHLKTSLSPSQRRLMALAAFRAASEVFETFDAGASESETTHA